MLTIKGYDKGVGEAAFWGWDIVGADESELLYTFWVKDRLMGWECKILLHRERVNGFYFCRVEDTDGKWSNGSNIPLHSLNNLSFWNWVEGVIKDVF